MDFMEVVDMGVGFMPNADLCFSGIQPSLVIT